MLSFSFFFTVSPPSAIYTLSLHDALPDLPPQDLVFEAVDSAGRRVTEVAARVRYDSTVVSLERWRIRARAPGWAAVRSEEHTSELQSRGHLVCRLLLEKKKQERTTAHDIR